VNKAGLEILRGWGIMRWCGIIRGWGIVEVNTVYRIPAAVYCFIIIDHPLSKYFA
jgi:hypothetical protein